MSDIIEKLVSVRWAAEYLGCHERSVYKWITQGRIPSVRLGRRHRIRRADLDALLQGGPPEVERETALRVPAAPSARGPVEGS